VPGRYQVAEESKPKSVPHHAESTRQHSGPVSTVVRRPRG
jgi:hypothetical protein